MGNNPLAGIDPNGENPLLIAGGLGAVGSVVFTLISNPNSSVQELFEAGSIGFLAGATGFGIAKYFTAPVTALLAKAGIAVGPFIKSVVAGALSGAGAGLASSGLKGDPCITALKSSVLGGIFGGLLGPLNAILKAGNFGLGAKAAINEAEGMVLGGIATLPAKLAISGAKKSILQTGVRYDLPLDIAGRNHIDYIDYSGGLSSLNPYGGPSIGAAK